MTKITAMVAGAALTFSVAASAAAQRGGASSAPGGRGRAPGLISRQMFRGITLSDSQRTQLQALGEQNRTRMQSLANAAQADRQALRTAWTNGDTVALNAARSKVRGQANTRVAMRAEFERNARAVLTSDQQKVFDANRTRLSERVGRGMRTQRVGMRAQRMGMRHRAMGRAMMRGHAHRAMWRHGVRSWSRHSAFWRRGGGFGAGRAMRGGPRNGFGPGAGMHRGLRDGFGPRMQRTPRGGGGGAPPADSGAVQGSGNMQPSSRLASTAGADNTPA